ncbi:hypothetical protein L1987_43164 [Smallanthus sonchifolius]|uniref:Uncharacterized protein n=1 Tax=Smallanthus sonchifolius TaxID=185202 RepID=A0ACB9GKV4_9ASTR|nr:hypothetical protein L1987_43164 [Smallanthus sonchifolius]
MFKESPTLNVFFKKFVPVDKKFTLDERVFWFEIIGLPLCAGTDNSYRKIMVYWGIFLFSYEDKDESMATGRVHEEGNNEQPQEPKLNDGQSKVDIQGDRNSDASTASVPPGFGKRGSLIRGR